jgi:hypothetical protein
VWTPHGALPDERAGSWGLDSNWDPVSDIDGVTTTTEYGTSAAIIPMRGTVIAPRVVLHYRIEGLLGRGGMGEI